MNVINIGNKPTKVPEVKKIADISRAVRRDIDKTVGAFISSLRSKDEPLKLIRRFVSGYTVGTKIKQTDVENMVASINRTAKSLYMKCAAPIEGGFNLDVYHTALVNLFSSIVVSIQERK